MLLCLSCLLTLAVQAGALLQPHLESHHHNLHYSLGGGTGGSDDEEDDEGQLDLWEDDTFQTFVTFILFYEPKWLKVTNKI